MRQVTDDTIRALEKLFETSLRLFKVSLRLIINIFSELSKANWRFIEMYAHDRAQGRRFDWSKLSNPQPAYYKIGIDLNLLQFLWDWSSGRED